MTMKLRTNMISKEQIHSMLKYPNQKLLDEEIIITLKLGHRKVKSNHL
jgi:hypothetical protein